VHEYFAWWSFGLLVRIASVESFRAGGRILLTDTPSPGKSEYENGDGK